MGSPAVRDGVGWDIYASHTPSPRAFAMRRYEFPCVRASIASEEGEDTSRLGRTMVEHCMAGLVSVCVSC
jgi:hypothetical protein